MLTPVPTLSQITNPLAIPDPTPLPAAPLWERLLLENPWPLTILLLAGAGIAWTVLNNRARPRDATKAAIALAGAGVGVFVLATLVSTTREGLRTAAADLVRAVARADAPAVRDACTSEAALYWWVNPKGLPLDDILDRVGRDFIPGGTYAVKDLAILASQAHVESPDHARVQIKVRVTPQSTGFPNISWWRLDYRLGSDGRWRVHGIQPLAISGVDNPAGR